MQKNKKTKIVIWETIGKVVVNELKFSAQVDINKLKLSTKFQFSISHLSLTKIANSLNFQKTYLVFEMFSFFSLTCS